MWCTVRNLAFATLVASTTVPQPVQGQTVPISHLTTTADAPLLTTDRTLLASLKRIWQGSPLWREAVAAVRKTGRRVLVATPIDVSMSRDQDVVGFDPRLLAEAIPVFDESSRIPLVVIVVNLRMVQEAHDARLSVPRDFEADLDRILVHEIYGHAVPYLLAGNLSGRCPDPQQGESASDACAIRRENAVRAELGLGRRADDGLYSLALALGTR
jgi:hypothetical protein